MNDVTVSRILHYVRNFDGRLLCKPAIVVSGSNTNGEIEELKVFLADSEFLVQQAKPDHYRRNEETWHWPRECENLKDA